LLQRSPVQRGRKVPLHQTAFGSVLVRGESASSMRRLRPHVKELGYELAWLSNVGFNRDRRAPGGRDEQSEIVCSGSGCAWELFSSWLAVPLTMVNRRRREVVRRRWKSRSSRTKRWMDHSRRKQY